MEGEKETGKFKSANTYKIISVAKRQNSIVQDTSQLYFQTGEATHEGYVFFEARWVP